MDKVGKIKSMGFFLQKGGAMNATYYIDSPVVYVTIGGLVVEKIDMRADDYALTTAKSKVAKYNRDANEARKAYERALERAR